MRDGCTLASGALQGNLRHALDQIGLLMPIGLFMRLEMEDSLGNEGRSARWQAMDFVVETGAFHQQDCRGRESDLALFAMTNSAHDCRLLFGGHS